MSTLKDVNRPFSLGSAYPQKAKIRYTIESAVEIEVIIGILGKE